MKLSIKNETTGFQINLLHLTCEYIALVFMLLSNFFIILFTFEIDISFSFRPQPMVVLAFILKYKYSAFTGSSNIHLSS